MGRDGLRSWLFKSIDLFRGGLRSGDMSSHYNAFSPHVLLFLKHMEQYSLMANTTQRTTFPICGFNFLVNPSATGPSLVHDRFKLHIISLQTLGKMGLRQYIMIHRFSTFLQEHFHLA